MLQTTDLASATNARCSQLRVLFVVPYVPSPIRVRPYNLLHALAHRGHAITLLCACGRDDDAALAALRPLCQRIVSLPSSRGAALASCARAALSSTPLQASYGSLPELVALLRQELASQVFDVVHVEHLRGAELALAALDATPEGLPLVFDSVDCISLLFERALRRSPALTTRAMALLDLARTRRYEAAYLTHFRQVLVTSPEDRWALETLRARYALPAMGKITVVPNGVDLDYFQPCDEARAPATLIFSGKMSYHANHAAALLLVEQIMPLIWRARADVRLQIVGANPARSLITKASDPRVSVTGYVPDLRPYLAQATLAVSPLLYGVGIQNKVLEAMAMATPVVTARQATLALAAREGQDLIVAEEPEQFAKQALELLADPATRATIGLSGRRYVERYHAWDTSAAMLEHCYAHASASLR